MAMRVGPLPCVLCKLGLNIRQCRQVKQLRNFIPLQTSQGSIGCDADFLEEVDNDVPSDALNHI